jgi:hypothetical protein
VSCSIPSKGAVLDNIAEDEVLGISTAFFVVLDVIEMTPLLDGADGEIA